MTETQEDVRPAGPVDQPAGTPNLNKALAAVQASLPRIEKGRTADVPTKNGGSYSYSYADLADVAAAIMPLLGAVGLSFTCWPTLSTNRFVLRYELLHESGESKTGEYPLPADASAQQLGSAITYARRYTLCSVTGVAPDDDDDAAAAEGRRQVEQVEERAELERELRHAVDSVRGAWANQYGEFDPEKAADMFKAWSRGGVMRNAPAGQLRAFAAYLHALPAADAGSEPTTEPEPPADDQVQEVPGDKPMSRRDQAHMFVLFEKLGMKDNRQGQLEYLRSVLERDLESRGDLYDDDAPLILKALKADVAEAESTGMATTQPGAGS